MQEQSPLRRYSSRAVLSASRFVVDYSWGNFKGDVAAGMLRHSAAAAMLENWADVRFIQEMLGHAKLTRQPGVHAPVHRKTVHAATHPAALLEGRRAGKDNPEVGG